jgi:hypothetical protein
MYELQRYVFPITNQLTSKDAAIVTSKGMIQPFPAHIVIDRFLIGIIAIHLIAGRPI